LPFFFVLELGQACQLVDLSSAAIRSFMEIAN
jgi:hypothetical protein